MDIKQIAAGLEARSVAIGRPIYQVCEEAGIAPATFYRWRNGETSATLAKINALSNKLDALERGRAA